MDTKYAIIDIEAINLSKSRSLTPGKYSRCHNCLRKVAILLYSDECVVYEGQPCVRQENLTKKELETFNFCRDKIHHLSYYPPSFYRPFTVCRNIPEMVKDYLHFNNISIVYYKGGCLEKDLCEKIGLESRNLEELGVKKARTHDPLAEVKFFKREIERIQQNSFENDKIALLNKGDQLRTEESKKRVSAIANIFSLFFVG